jgi:DNA-binding CsgD family transcriptional regulator
MVDGMTNLRIAKLLALSPSTIRNDLTSIYRKLGVATRAEAAAAAISLAMAQQRPKDEEDSARSNW